MNFISKYFNMSRVFLELGTFFYRCKIIPYNINYYLAKLFYEKAVEKYNSTPAMNNLGILYYNGFGADKNLTKTAELYKIAVENGEVTSISNLAYLYSVGEGVKRDINKAIELYEKAIELGNTKCLYNLGILYTSTNLPNFEPNYVKAVEIFTKAVKLGDNNAVNQLGLLYRHGNGVKMSIEKAVELFEKAMDGGCNYAILNLSSIYLGNDANIPKALELCSQLLSTSKDSNIMLSLARLLRNEYIYTVYTRERGRLMCLKAYKKAIKLKNVTAMCDLSRDYQFGNFPCINENPEKEKKLLKKAINLGSIKACVYLGQIMETVDDKMKLYKQAMLMVEKEISKGKDINSIFNIEISLNLGYRKDNYLLKKYIKKKVKLEQENKQLKMQIEDLKYRPGGIGYIKAKEHFLDSC